MIFRSVLVLGALAGLAALSGSANAQGYSPPPYGAQAYPPPYRPVPAAPIPDDDDDDIPASQRATGNIPPPPGGYRGPFASEPRRAPVDQSALPPAYGRRPSSMAAARPRRRPMPPRAGTTASPNR